MMLNGGGRVSEMKKKKRKCFRYYCFDDNDNGVENDYCTLAELSDEQWNEKNTERKKWIKLLTIVVHLVANK